MDTCHYCGTSYHPMPVYARGGGTPEYVRTFWGDREASGKPFQITVCHSRYDEKKKAMVQHDACRKKAIADGYRHMPTWTPSR